MYRWWINTWKDAPYYMTSGECKLKWQWDTTPYLWEWPKIWNSDSTKCCQRRGADRNKKWCSHIGGQLVWKFYIYTYIYIYIYIYIYTHTHILLLSRFSHVRLCATHRWQPTRLPLVESLGFSRQEYWSGLPFLSPMHQSENWKWCCSVVSNS